MKSTLDRSSCDEPGCSEPAEYRAEWSGALVAYYCQWCADRVANTSALYGNHANIRRMTAIDYANRLGGRS